MEHSKGDPARFEDIIKIYGTLDDYLRAPFDQVSLWCRLDFTETAHNVSRRKFKANVPCYPDGKPCPKWKCGAWKDPVNGEVWGP